MASHISAVLDAHLAKAPQQRENVAAMKQFMKDTNTIPDSKKPILYAIDGKAGLATVTTYGETLQAVRAEKPEALAHFFVCYWIYELPTLFIYLEYGDLSPRY